MASVSSPPTSLHLNNRLDLESIRVLISLVSQHICRFLSDPNARKALQQECIARISTRRHGHFEFSEHTVLSNLYWGIDAVEVAIQAECPEERTARLLNSERMLQIPALLDEHGSTAGMANQYLVSCSYFYLSLVRGLRGDKWQMAMHFLQALLVAPHRVRTEFAPDLCARLFNFSGGKGVTDEEMRQLARRYKDWLMYYQVILYGETPQKSMGEDMKGGASPSSRYKKSASDGYFYSNAQADTCATHQDSLMLHPEYLPEYKGGERITRVKSSMVSVLTHKEPNVREDGGIFFDNWDEGIFLQNRESFDLKRLQEMLEESQSNTSVSLYSLDDSTEASDSEEKTRHKGSHEKILIGNAGILAAQLGDRSSLVRSPGTSLKFIETCTSEAPKYSMHLENCGIKTSPLLSNNTHSSVSDLDLSIYDLRDVDSYPSNNCYMEYGTPSGRSPACKFRCFGKLLQKYAVPELIPHGSVVRKRIDFSTTEKKWCETNPNYENDTLIMLRRFEKAVSSICFSKGLGKCEDAGLEVTAVWEMLNNKPEAKYSTLKEDIIGKLMDIISTTREEKVMKTSVSILLILIAEDSSIIQDIKRKDLHLYHLARALKTNVHEAAILIFLLRPSPSEIKDLELLPTLVEVACNSNSHIEGSLSLPLSPTAASIAMIEILVTAFDYVTNNMHMSAISSPQILSKLVNVARNKKLEEGIALAAILVRCMRLNGNCRKFLSQVTPIDPFLHLLRSTERHAKYAAVEYFHEILQMPRSSVIGLLRQIQHQGSIGIMHSLMACIEQAQLEHQLLAAHLLLQLDMLEGSSGKSVFKKAAMEVLLKSVAFEECSTSRMLAAFILSNLGGTYAWTGQSYTAAWLLKKAGLTSMSNKNVIRNIDWNDPCLQDGDMAAWSRKTARNIIKIGISIFEALAKGIQSKLRSVSRDCLIVVAWLGCEMASMPPSNLRYSACEMLLGGVAQFLHPGSELDERVLACLCLYNYASGKGMQKLMNFSEGLRESLRRLSGITWMAEELLKVTDYFLPTEPHVSCVHTQILEAGHFGSGAATALIFYKGQLCGGYSDGSIKVWDIEGQSGKFASEVKAHRKPLTCFALFEPGSSLLSGSADKTIRVWQVVNKQLECVDVIEIKEPIHKIGTYGNRIFVITKSRGLKVLHASRIVKSILNNKHAKCLAVTQAKIYLGCTDSSLQVVDTISNQSQEIKARVNKWHMQRKPINSICVYKNWIYSAGSSVEGSTSKEWRRHNKPRWAIRMGRGTCVQEMAMVEDFLYLTCSSYPSVLQIWLRGNPQKVGTLSAGSKIMSLLTANDIVFCGTETGLIKAWIPV